MWQLPVIPIMKQSKDSNICKNAATHYRHFNEVKNGTCILGDFNRIHRSFCWCDLHNINVNRRVELSCVICLLYEKLSYNALPVPANSTKNLRFNDFMNVIFGLELEKIKTAHYEIDCGLPQKELVKCYNKFDRIYKKFKNQGWIA